MNVALNKDLATKHLGLTAEVCLNNVAKLLFVTELVETGLVEEGENNGAYSAFFEGERAVLEVAQ